MKIDHIEYFPWDSQEDILDRIKSCNALDRVKLIYTETPANPTNDLFDIAMLVDLGKKLSQGDHLVKVAVDNTYMGPLWQRPLELGADFSIYSATKYIGGHSDVIAGAVCGKKDDMIRIKTLRTFLGNMAGPWTAWLLMRSLETLKIRMEQQAINAKHVAEFLNHHPKIEKVFYLGNLQPKDGKAYEIYQRQYTSAGAMMSFSVKGGEAEAFRLLNALELCKLAVSLGSTESLAEHPATMTHAGVDAQLKEKIGITPSLIRLSVGVERAEDLIDDLRQALEKV
jgi:methionine-gamma-lyase